MCLVPFPCPSPCVRASPRPSHELSPSPSLHVSALPPRPLTLRPVQGGRFWPRMINEHVYLISKEVLLVPYLAPFVPRYHEWMCNPVLLAATESEPLSLEEEQENQRSWLHSTDKLTFILLAPLTANPDVASAGECNSPGRNAEVSQERRVDTRACRVCLREAVRPLAEVFAATPSSPGASQASCCRPVAAASCPGSIVTAADRTSLVARPHPPQGMHSPLGNGSPLLKRYVPSHVKELFNREVSSAPQSQGAYVGGDEAQRRALAQTYVMIGDCNLFLLEEDDSEEADDFPACAGSSASGPQPRCRSPISTAILSERSPPLSSASAVAPSRTFEVEVMVADPAFRRRGLAESAVRMIMQYAVAVCGATRFVAKILQTNTSSIALFTERLKFAPFKEVKVFHEVHFTRSLRTEGERRAWELECRRRWLERAVCGKACLHSQAARCGSCAVSSSDDSGGAERTAALLSVPPTLSEQTGWAMSPTFWCAPLDEAVAASLEIFTQVP
ncbi:hypothetical protein LSCM1_02904 [Leishmania martiniquensis]|uniref:N-acetyltransferase domain-containing protein n=1 Tax=Leishmania martiniquensis TaxID=1580590 RepID=A0A836KQI6_9TRYP|nr:hypothetical protein LSCM1_02904 [Leishmania martiniquensis]